ncbi:MAG: Rab family GTPase [Candidatus Hodarchaeota archaeon]
MKKSVKIIIAGDGGVGKTTFLHRFITGKFYSKFELTKGVSFFNKDLKINREVYQLILWDFAGQLQFRELLPDFVKGLVGAILMFDLSRFDTLKRLDNWVKMINKEQIVPIIIVGGKYDLVKDEIETILNIDNIILNFLMNNDTCFSYLKTSSKTGYNVKKAFDLLIYELIL